MQAPVETVTKRQPRFGEFVTLAAFMMGLTAFAVDNVLPAFTALGHHFQVADPNRLQWLVYMYMVGFGAMHLVYGPASDMFGRRPAFLVGLVIFLAGCVAAIFAPDFETLLAARVAQGAGAAAGRVVAVAIVRDRFQGREMARVMSLTMMIFITVPIFAPAIGGAILTVFDWRAIFASMLLLGLAAGLWFAKRMPETLKTENRMTVSVASVASSFRLTATNRVALGYATAFGCLFGSIMAYVGSSQQIFAGEVYGLGAWFPVAFASIAFMMGVAGFVNSRLVRRWGMHRLSHWALIGFLVLGVVQCAAALAWSGRPPLLVFGVLLGISHFLTSLAMPNCNALAMEPLGRIAGTASSLIGFYTTLLGALLGGYIGQHFDGTVTPLAFGYLGLAILALGVVVVTERGRLFRPVHAEPP
jgi:DHA1 family bicyclomycin/chloramphenicol resistance-like MFS transporter